MKLVKSSKLKLMKTDLETIGLIYMRPGWCAWVLNSESVCTLLRSDGGHPQRESGQAGDRHPHHQQEHVPHAQDRSLPQPTPRGLCATSANPSTTACWTTWATESRYWISGLLIRTDLCRQMGFWHSSQRQHQNIFLCLSLLFSQVVVVVTFRLNC